MKPSKPFLFTLSLVAVGAAGIFGMRTTRVAAAQDTMPLSTRLTPEMIDYFGLAIAYEHPSIPALVACQATPACGNSDSSQVRVIDAGGAPLTAYDDKATTTIERVQRRQSAPRPGVRESRTTVRRYSQDGRGHVIVNGTDSITTVDPGGPGTAASTVTRVHRYADVRFMLSDLHFIWPITGLVVLELSSTPGPSGPAPLPPMAHAAVSFDGSPYAHVLTTGALSHRVNLATRRLETTMPDR